MYRTETKGEIIKGPQKEFLIDLHWDLDFYKNFENNPVKIPILCM